MWFLHSSSRTLPVFLHTPAWHRPCPPPRVRYRPCTAAVHSLCGHRVVERQHTRVEALVPLPPHLHPRANGALAVDAHLGSEGEEGGEGEREHR